MSEREGGTDAEKNRLLEMVNKQYKSFADEAKRHKFLFRGLWLMATTVSLLIAYFTSFPFSIYGVTSANLATGLAIVLPVLSGYMVMRSPERLWIHEISVRNKLGDLAKQIVLAIDQDPKVDLSQHTKEYFEIMRRASETWVSLKSQGATGPNP